MGYYPSQSHQVVQIIMQYWNGFTQFQVTQDGHIKYKDSYIDQDDTWLVILASTSFKIFSTINRSKVYSAGQLVFGHYTILPIKHTEGWLLISQKIRRNIRKHTKIVDHDYKSGDKIMITNNSAFKYENLYNRPFERTQCLDQWHGCITVRCSNNQV